MRGGKGSASARAVTTTRMSRRNLLLLALLSLLHIIRYFPSPSGAVNKGEEARWRREGLMASPAPIFATEGNDDRS